MQNHRESLLVEWINHTTPFSVKQLSSISGDASFRRYFRFTHQDKTIIAVDAPPESEDTQQFIAVAQSLKALEIATPTIFYYDDSQGFLCIEDFGDTLLIDTLNSVNQQSLYQNALNIIPQLQKMTTTSLGPLSNYDEAMAKFEMNLFDEWFLSHYLALPLNDAQRTALTTCFDYIAAHFAAQPQVGVHRDFHSRNLMMLKDQTIGVIDFQGAVLGPITYDAASLLRDCYVNHSETFIMGLLKQWHTNHYASVEWETFLFWFDITSLQRFIKIAGIFSRLALRDNKHSYLPYIPTVINSMLLIIQRYPDLSPFHDLLINDVMPKLEQKAC